MRRVLSGLYAQVLLAIVVGAAVGHFAPETGTALKPLGDAFVKLVKMVVTPIVFCTVVVGIASMGDLKKVGRVGAKALIYFEVVTTMALIIGLVTVNLVRPGRRHPRRPGRARLAGGGRATPRRRASRTG